MEQKRRLAIADPLKVKDSQALQAVESQADVVAEVVQFTSKNSEEDSEKQSGMRAQAQKIAGKMSEEEVLAPMKNLAYISSIHHPVWQKQNAQWYGQENLESCDSQSSVNSRPNVNPSPYYICRNRPEELLDRSERKVRTHRAQDSSIAISLN